jgi:hypothetical protein
MRNGTYLYRSDPPQACRAATVSNGCLEFPSRFGSGDAGLGTLMGLATRYNDLGGAKGMVNFYV